MKGEKVDDAWDALMARQTAAERMIEALALGLDRSGVLPLAAWLSIAEVLRLNATVTESPDVATCMGFVIDRLRAHQKSGAPLRDLCIGTALFARTDPTLRDALASWLATATIPEIEDDLREWLAVPAGSVRPGSPPPPDVRGEPGEAGG
jgi:hypothetical protein